jgi:hypothetical protein
MTWAEQSKPEDLTLMSATYRHLASECGALLAPVGELFREVQEQRPDIDLFWQDGAHASSYGDYLIAAVFAALMTGKKDLSALSDSGADFMVSFGSEDLMPHASEDTDAVKIPLDPEKTEFLKRIAGKAAEEG